MSLAANIILLGSARSGALLDLNFAQGVYVYRGSPTSLTSLSGWSYTGSVSGTGATVRTAPTSSGSLATFANGVPRVTDLGLLVEMAATNSFLNSATGVTQSVTTTAASWTLSFYGTGSIVLSGSATGTLSGTGANNRVSLTVTATAASCTLTVSGSVTSVQFEAGALPSSYIPTAGGAAARTADIPAIGSFVVPSAYTLLASVDTPNVATSTDRYALATGNSSGSLAIQSSTNLAMGILPGLSIPWTQARTASATKLASRFAQGDVRGSVDGTLSAQAVNTWAPGSGTTVGLGNVASVGQLNGFLKRAAIYGGAYSNGQLHALTQ